MVDISVQQLTGFGLANVLPRRGVAPDAIGTALGMTVGEGPVTSVGETLALWGNAPGQWLAYTGIASTDWADDLAHKLAGTAAVVDQSSAYVLFNLTGIDAQRLLQKGLPVDLATLEPGAVVVSTIAHLGVIVQFGAPGDYFLATFRSFTGALRHWIDASIAAL
ncbi:sarcosine oxidase subunit gamma [Novosphingobium sp.]|uniref:sarcosine oxidase subunit gamma n=1 Tax=Novosphingobium sp. TaxID=1874826 RepID=UPI003B51E50D